MIFGGNHGCVQSPFLRRKPDALLAPNSPWGAPQQPWLLFAASPPWSQAMGVFLTSNHSDFSIKHWDFIDLYDFIHQQFGLLTTQNWGLTINNWVLSTEHDDLTTTKCCLTIKHVWFTTKNSEVLSNMWNHRTWGLTWFDNPECEVNPLKHQRAVRSVPRYHPSQTSMRQLAVKHSRSRGWHRMAQWNNHSTQLSTNEVFTQYPVTTVPRSKQVLEQLVMGSKPFPSWDPPPPKSLAETPRPKRPGRSCCGENHGLPTNN